MKKFCTHLPMLSCKGYCIAYRKVSADTSRSRNCCVVRKLHEHMFCGAEEKYWCSYGCTFQTHCTDQKKNINILRKVYIFGRSSEEDCQSKIAIVNNLSCTWAIGKTRCSWWAMQDCWVSMRWRLSNDIFLCEAHYNNIESQHEPRPKDQFHRVPKTCWQHFLQKSKLVDVDRTLLQAVVYCTTTRWLRFNIYFEIPLKSGVP